MVSVFTHSIVVYNNAYIKNVDTLSIYRDLYSKRVYTIDYRVQ